MLFTFAIGETASTNLVSLRKIRPSHGVPMVLSSGIADIHFIVVGDIHELLVHTSVELVTLLRVVEHGEEVLISSSIW